MEQLIFVKALAEAFSLLSRACVHVGVDVVSAPLVIPSMCIGGRDIVITLLVRVCVCLSVCLHLIAS